MTGITDDVQAGGRASAGAGEGDGANGESTADPALSRAGMLLRVVRRAAVFVVVGYAIYLTFAAFTQEQIYFPRFYTIDVDANPVLPRGVESMWIEPEEGVRVEAWLAMPEGASAARPVPLVVFLHGNAEVIDEGAMMVSSYLARGVAVLMPEYRGYGRSTGSPTEVDIRDDVVSFLELVTAREEVAGMPVIYHGRSIGGGIAGAVARVREPDALILESSFVALRAMMNRYAVPTFLARNRMETREMLGTLDVPVLVIHGDADVIVPYWHGVANAERALDAELVTIPGAGHNDVLPTDPLVVAAIDALLARVGWGGWESDRSRGDELDAGGDE